MAALAREGCSHTVFMQLLYEGRKDRELRSIVSRLTRDMDIARIAGAQISFVVAYTAPAICDSSEECVLPIVQKAPKHPENLSLNEDRAFNEVRVARGRDVTNNLCGLETLLAGFVSKERVRREAQAKA